MGWGTPGSRAAASDWTHFRAAGHVPPTKKKSPAAVGVCILLQVTLQAEVALSMHDLVVIRHLHRPLCDGDCTIWSCPLFTLKNCGTSDRVSNRRGRQTRRLPAEGELVWHPCPSPLILHLLSDWFRRGACLPGPTKSWKCSLLHYRHLHQKPDEQNARLRALHPYSDPIQVKYSALNFQLILSFSICLSH